MLKCTKYVKVVWCSLFFWELGLIITPLVKYLHLTSYHFSSWGISLTWPQLNLSSLKLWQNVFSDVEPYHTNFFLCFVALQKFFKYYADTSSPKPSSDEENKMDLLTKGRVLINDTDASFWKSSQSKLRNPTQRFPNHLACLFSSLWHCIWVLFDEAGASWDPAVCILHVAFHSGVIYTFCMLCLNLCWAEMMSLMVVDAAVTENSEEKQAVSLTNEETPHNISVFAIFKKVFFKELPSV